MRLILSMILIASATALLCHGYYHRDEADAALSEARSVKQYETLGGEYPYSLAAVRAAESRLEALVKSPPQPTGETLFAAVVEEIEGGIDFETEPFIAPAAAGAAALAGLLLAILLPGTRFRGLSIIVFLAGVAALMPGQMEPSRQVDLISKVGFAREVIAWGPMISLGMLTAAALSLGFRTRPD